MKQIYFPVVALATAALLLGGAHAGRAQHVFTDTTLAPYRQNFDDLPAQVAFRNNRTWPGVYVLAEADPGTMPPGYPTTYVPTTIKANDGSDVQADYFHFGSPGSAERAFGGIASTRLVSATGYVGIRFRNNSSAVIRNLEIQYAMEQWYNSGRQDQARVGVAYLRAAAGDTTGSLSREAGTWTVVPALAVEAPSTATAVTSRDGNAPSNRRVRQATLENIDLLPGQEIMLRWDYVLNSDTNGNGLSIDEVVVTPVTNAFFLTNAQPGTLTSWNTSANGTGQAPTSFTADNQVFYIVGRDIDISALPITGTNSKVVVGTAHQPASATVADNAALATSIDVAAGSALLVRGTEAAGGAAFRLGALAPTSTVTYAAETGSQRVLTASYGHLRLVGAASKELAGALIMEGNLTLAGAPLRLGNYDLTINREGQLKQSQTTAYLVTDGRGRLRRTVRSNNQAVLFPVGTAQAYLPVMLWQAQERSEDVFEVRVADEQYAHYDAHEQGLGAALTSNVVRKTWFVSEEVAGNSNLAMQVQWAATDATADFNPARAYVAHYHGGSWDGAAGPVGATGTGPFTATRTGLTSFSPFGVTAALPLPVAQATQGATLTVVPNPGQGRFELVSSRAETTPQQGVILDVLGWDVLHLTQPAGSQRTAFDLSNQPAGLYLLRLTGNPHTLRIIKQ